MNVEAETFISWPEKSGKPQNHCHEMKNDTDIFISCPEKTTAK